MCGIAGFANMGYTYDDARHLLDRMCKVMRHRGPDEQGIWVGASARYDIALGMRRLSIIDITGGQQPICNEDHTMLVVLNGEIYNYRELQDELSSRGHTFRTRSDTETILHAYEEYGDACVKHLRGMFAFALWDTRRERLLLARDRFGKKPLYYYWDGTHLLFASEIKSILQASIPREINPNALDEFLVYRYVPAPNTIFRDIYKLPAAHTLIYERGNIQTARYWDLSFVPSCTDNEETAIARIGELLRDAVRVRLMSEVPLGAFLSGGLDSSVVVALMNSLQAQPVKTFSIGFDEEDYSELPYARRVARYLNTEHVELVVRPELVSVLPQLVWDFDEPFGDSSMLPTYYVSKLAREYVTVVLSGDGGDEIFAGYRHYARERAIQYFPAALRSLLASKSAWLPDGMRGKKRLRNLDQSLPMRYVQGTMIFPVGARPSLYTAEYFAHVRSTNPYACQTSLFNAISDLDVVAQMQYVDAHRYLVDDILVKVDRTSMLNSLETRAPLLDQHLVEYVASLPSELRMRHGTLKYLLKRVAADLLPPEIVRRKKRGFTIPLGCWFRGELAPFAHEVLQSSRFRQRGIFNPHFVNSLLRAHQRSSLVDHSSALWCLLCLELWFQIYMDSPALSPQHAQQLYSVLN